jgi:hypothetical protein
VARPHHLGLAVEQPSLPGGATLLLGRTSRLDRTVGFVGAIAQSGSSDGS